MLEAKGDGDNAATMFGVLDLRLDDGTAAAVADAWTRPRSLGADAPIHRHQPCENIGSHLYQVFFV